MNNPIKIYDPITGMYSVMEYSEIFETIKCVNNVIKSKHHKVFLLDELLGAFDFPTSALACAIQVSKDIPVSGIFSVDGVFTLKYCLNENYISS